MKFFINNKEISRFSIYYRGLGFGEEIDNPISYKFEIPLDMLKDDLRNHINEFIKECKIDDEEVGGSPVRSLSIVCNNEQKTWSLKVLEILESKNLLKKAR